MTTLVAQVTCTGRKRKTALNEVTASQGSEASTLLATLMLLFVAVPACADALSTYSPAGPLQAYLSEPSAQAVPVKHLSVATETSPANRAAIDRMTAAARRDAAADNAPAWYREASTAGGATAITVNTLAGDDDSICGIDPLDPVQDCSLLEAVALANSDPGANVIAFSVSGTIALSAAVVLLETTRINGSTAPGGVGSVFLDGQDVVENVVTVADGAGSVIEGLVIGQSARSGVLIIAPASDVSVLGNFIGTNAAGDDLGNDTSTSGSAGISIQGASGTTIGGTEAGQGNVIGFGRTGIFLNSSPGTAILGNHVGTNAAEASLGNALSGVFISGSTSAAEVGGTAPGAGNVVGFNAGVGIVISDSGATGNSVQGNLIGTNGAGANLGNGGAGIQIQNASGNTVGGTEPGAGNTVGFNANGIVIFPTTALATNNVVAGNFIGTNVTGGNLGNASLGVWIEEGSGNTVGGSEPGAGNTIGFNGQDGIRVVGGNGNVVAGNFVGTDAAGANLGNGANGITTSSTGSIIGGADAGNTTGFNEVNGIAIYGTLTAVRGNYVGTNADGIALPNALSGVIIFGNSNTLGGAAPGEGNTIGFNGVDGVVVIGADAVGNVIIGNAIGTDADGADLGNGRHGIFLTDGAQGNTIGTAGAGNTIGFNGIDGVALSGIVVRSNLIQSNYLGTNAAGADLGNTGHGVFIRNLSEDVRFNTVGRNVIRFNNAGVRVEGASDGFNSSVLNASSDNEGLGIDLAIGASDSGVTPNDGCFDPDTSLQNFPVLISEVAAFGAKIVDFDLDSAPGEYRVEFFSSPAADPSGFGEGGTLLAVETVTVSAGCGETFQATMPAPATGHFITATATPLMPSAPFGLGGTSEFGAALLVVSEPSPIIVNTLDGGNDGVCGGDGQDEIQDCSLLEAVELASNSPGADAIHFAVDGVIQIASTVLIASSVTLDGTTAPGGPHAVRIDASGASGNAIVITGADASGSEIRGLVVGQATGSGIVIESGAESVRVVGNFIGTNTGGDNLGNAGNGVLIHGGSTLNTIGGTGAGAGNTIGFNEFGVTIEGAGTTGNTLLGNFIGTNAAGDQTLGNRVHGVLLRNGASGNSIGGPGAGNSIGLNIVDGVFIQGATTTGNTLLGNAIGTSLDGQNLGNGRFGVVVTSGASDNAIGAAGAGNTIGFNGFDGVLLQSAGTTGNTIEGNYIGTNVAGQDLGNLRHGVTAAGGASDNRIGGAAAGAGNTIGLNGGSGVLVLNPSTVDNAILGNAIFDNDGLGIDLSESSVVGDGVTPNDGCGDPDAGSNGFQNFPVLLSVLVGGGNTTIDLDLDTAAGDYRVEFFSVPLADSSGHGEGLTFLGAEQVSVSGTCEESFQVVLPLTLAAGERVTATATPVNGAQPSSFGGTSEFSAAASTLATPIQIAINAGDGQSAIAGQAVAVPPRVIVRDANDIPVAGVAVTFAVASGGGTVDPMTAVTTGADGVSAVVSWTLGATPGINTLTASAAGLNDVTFTATGTATYAVTTTAINGSITSAVDPLVEDGQTTTVTGQADPDHFFASVSGCGGTPQSNSDPSVTSFSYETGPVTAACAVDASFVRIASDLQIAKDSSVPEALDGQVVVYSITVTNAGPLPAIGAQVVDTLPAELVDGVWACQPVDSNTACPPPPHDAGEGDLSALVDLSVDGFLRYDLSARVQAGSGATVSNTASIAPPDGLDDADPSNNSATSTVLIVPQGVFADGFEPDQAPLTVPAAAKAQRKAAGR